VIGWKNSKPNRRYDDLTAIENGVTLYRDQGKNRRKKNKSEPVNPHVFAKNQSKPAKTKAGCTRQKRAIF
jgi:hypothetical protein